MGGQYKKKLRAEKSKVKLKSTKLPKGLNVTKTEFKVRKILIREQLRDSELVDGKRQINLKENISRLKHHSVNMRLDALKNLREIIVSSYPGILSQLNEVIRGISAICLDTEKNVRRESHKVLSALLNALPTDKVKPFFHVISAFLRCAMTHVLPAVQEDSLLMLDILLQYVPRLVVVDSANIFQNFLEMISRSRADGDRSGRTLTVRMGNKQTTITWRSKVLKRLQQILKTMAEYKKTNINRNTSAVKNFQIRTFNAKEPQFYSLKRVFATTEHSPLFNNVISESSDVITDESVIVRGYIEHLMPLLIDSWIEVRPQEVYADEQMLLTSDAAFTLQILLNIIENLWELVQVHDGIVENNKIGCWFKNEYNEAFVTNFIQFGFPYQMIERTGEKLTKKTKKSQVEISEQFCLAQNISIIYLTALFYRQEKNAKSETFIKKFQYLNKILKNIKKYKIDDCRGLEKALRVFLLDNGYEFLQIDTEQMHLLLRSTIDSFLTHKEMGTNTLIFLCDIVKQTNLLNAYGHSNFKNFLEYLPQLLINSTITEDALISMTNLAKQKNNIFLQALEKQTELVIENIQKIQVIGAANAFEGKKYIMNLFYWIETNWSSDKIEYLIKKVESNVTDKRILSYFKDIFLTHLK